ncbi:MULTISPECIES: protease inhibitor I42 family protein [Methanobacterium]|jgi:predicted secreted protein|uniref:Proteinase inhibitor I42 chagasin domain-containing protein n=1 Tax=Methanobacterium bryantii TaxID=2161 RepID=A0A2A2H4B4_METBR|nr:MULTISPECIES: protease inhibitor I42 family protein [Methanobacterium]OEC84826.1 hypothetical protein A9507_14660 [Methanobacterium sp. A39]PAV04205.1 hypothetical protein ASJ80_04970 [Methanobacterium bryantii]
MKCLKTASILILAVFSLSMVSGVFAADRCILPVKEEKKLTVNVNEKFNITLESNPSTGYKWISEFDSNSLKLVNETYIPDMPIRCGSGGYQIFTFKALKTGKTDLTMKYIMPWENCLPAKEIIYHINIVN